MNTSSVRIASTAHRAVLAVAIAIGIAIGAVHLPATAGLFFEQLQTIETQQLANENTRHQAVLKEIELEGQVADKKLAGQLKICTTASCKAAQRSDNLRTHKQLDVEEEHENAAHAAKMAQIKANFAAEEKANAPAPAPKASK
jgi:hypothetical protein